MKFRVKMTSKDLFEFSMYNSYKGGMGLFNAIFTVGALALLVFTWSWVNVWQKCLLVGCALIFTVLQPLLLHFKAGKQAEAPGFSTPIDMTFSDENIFVEQAGVEGGIEWENVWKAVRIPTMFILMMGPSHAYLLPNRSVEGHEDELIDILKKHLPEKKTKGLKL